MPLTLLDHLATPRANQLSLIGAAPLTELTAGDLKLAVPKTWVVVKNPAMSVWYTLSNRAAYMWTWLGPDPKGKELDEAMKIVMGARELHDAAPPRAR